jgi:hypothetical protein
MSYPKPLNFFLSDTILLLTIHYYFYADRKFFYISFGLRVLEKKTEFSNFSAAFFIIEGQYMCNQEMAGKVR